MFRLFPCTITPDGRKVPLITDWQTKATTDQDQLMTWQELYRDRLKFWGVPTGLDSNLLVLDIDIKHDGPGHIKRLGLDIPNTMWQQTKSGGYHFLFTYPQDGRHYGNRTNLFGSRETPTGIDIRGQGGFIIYYGCSSHVIAQAPPWLLEAMNAKEKVEPKGDPIKLDPNVASPIILSALENIRNAAPGESNNVLNIEAFKLGQLVASASITREYAEKVLFDAAIERGKPHYEAKATIKSGLDGGIKQPLTSPFGNQAPVLASNLPFGVETQGRWTPTFATREDLMNSAALRKPQLFEDWSTEDIIITTGDGGTGKTTLKLFEAICLALGDRFLGFECKQPGKTLYITGEDTEKKLTAMLGAIIRQMGLFEQSVVNDGKIQTILDSILIKKDADLCLISKDRQGFISPNLESMRKVLEAIDDIKPKMVVFDPISSFWGSESALNDMNRAVTKFIGSIVERGVAVEMINHMGKSSSSQKDMTQFAGRGGTGLPSNARISRTLRGIDGEEFEEMTGQTLGENQSAMLCVVNKFTDGSPLYNKPFLVVREGYLFHRRSLSDSKAREVEKKLTDLERVFSYIKEVRNQDRYPSRKVVEAYFMTQAEPAISKERTKRALDMLIFQGHLGEFVKEIDNPDLTQKDRVLVIVDSTGAER